MSNDSIYFGSNIYHQSINDLAIKNAEEIAEFLKKNHSGKNIKKNSLKFKFNLPSTRSSLVFSYLEELGFVNDRFTIKVPKSIPSSES